MGFSTPKGTLVSAKVFARFWRENVHSKTYQTCATLVFVLRICLSVDVLHYIRFFDIATYKTMKIFFRIVFRIWDGSWRILNKFLILLKNWYTRLNIPNDSRSNSNFFEKVGICQNLVKVSLKKHFQNLHKFTYCKHLSYVYTDK